MNVDIIDTAAFQGFSPAQLTNYLRSRNWQVVRTEPGFVEVWQLGSEGAKKHRVWVPLDVTVADYASSVGRAVKSVALAEERSQLELVEDLDSVAVGDVIRAICWDDLDRNSSSLPYHEGAALIRRCYHVTQAAAMAVEEKRPVYPYQTTRRVSEYLRSLRLGQTERGSYAVKAISPIQTDVVSANLPLPSLEDVRERVPFERQVTLTLVTGLDALEQTVSDAYRRGRFYFEPFQEIVPAGVSANLCEAIVGIDRGEGEISTSPLRVSVSWSYALPSPHDLAPVTFTFEPTAMPYLREAATQFRARNPEDTTLRGFVISLQRQQNEEEGHIRIVCRIDDRSRVVRLALSPDDYRAALRAHEDDAEVECDGTLVWQRYYYHLQNPRRFRVIERPPPEYYQDSFPQFGN